MQLMNENRIELLNKRIEEKENDNFLLRTKYNESEKNYRGGDKDQISNLEFVIKEYQNKYQKTLDELHLEKNKKTSNYDINFKLENLE